LNFFKMAWESQNTDDVVQNVLANEFFWGQDLNKIKGLSEVVAKALKQIETETKIFVS